ncbi:MAG: CocE/NonD family hydrolase C-terminal non-catalytic domain-containing protein [Streptococcus sp.]
MPLKRYKTHKVKSVVIARGWMNLANPASRYDSASSSHSIDLKENEYHDYTMYLQPNLYTVKKGHRLVLSLHTYDPDYIYFADPYEVTFKTDSISATIPIVEDSRSLLFRCNQVKRYRVCVIGRSDLANCNHSAKSRS